jgi:hypothetical protein
MQNPFRRTALPAIESLVALDRLALAAERRAIILHCFADTVRQEPSRLVRYPERAMQLVRGDAFLAGAHQADRQQPFVQRDMRALENHADAHRELVLA